MTPELTEHSGIINSRYVGPRDDLRERSALVKNGSTPQMVSAFFQAPVNHVRWGELPRTDFIDWSPKV